MKRSEMLKESHDIISQMSECHNKVVFYSLNFQRACCESEEKWCLNEMNKNTKRYNELLEDLIDVYKGEE